MTGYDATQASSATSGFTRQTGAAAGGSVTRLSTYAATASIYAAAGPEGQTGTELSTDSEEPMLIHAQQLLLRHGDVADET